MHTHPDLMPRYLTNREESGAGAGSLGGGGGRRIQHGNTSNNMFIVLNVVNDAHFKPCSVDTVCAREVG
jgi:hypothetical protein